MVGAALRCRQATTLPGRVQPGLDPLRRDGVRKVVPDVVLAGPLQADRCVQGARQQGGLQHVVALGLAAKPAAQQRDVDGHRRLRDAERLGEVLPRAAGALHGSPDLDLAVGIIRRRDRRLHADMGEMRQIVFADHHLGGALEARLDVAGIAHDLARRPHRRLELLAVVGAVVVRVGAVIPHDLERVAALDRGAGVAGNDRHPAQRLELGRPGVALGRHHLLHAGHRHGVLGVERDELAAHDRRASDDRVFHAGEADIGAVRRPADGDVAQVDDGDLALADVAEILRVLQPQRRSLRHRLRGCIRRQVAIAQPPPARLVHDLVVGRADLGDRHLPARRRRRFQHHAGRGAHLAHRDQVMPGAAGAVGVLVAVFLLVARGLLDVHPRPIGLHLVGDDHRQAGAHARPHLRPVRDDGDGAVRRDAHEHFGVVDGAVRHGARAGGVRRHRPARQHGCGQHEAAGDAQALQHRAAGDLDDLVHDQAPVLASRTALAMRW
jgi:hypothetical protein